MPAKKTARKKTTRRTKARVATFTRTPNPVPEAIESAPEAPAEPQPAPAPEAEPETAAQPATLADLAAAFEIHLEAQSVGTAKSYARELALACSVLGAETPLADLTLKVVADFFDHPRVTTTRDGAPKAASSVAKTRRVLRLALAWAAERGIIDPIVPA